MKRLEGLLRHAYTHVPYYKKLFNERGLKPQDIQSIDDLKKLPCLTKDAFKENYHELIERGADLDKFPQAHTSGTTGKPLQFYENPWTAQMERAFIYHQWARVGVRPGDAIVQLRGGIIQGTKPEYYLKNHKLRLSPQLDNLQTVRDYLQIMKNFEAPYLHGYPSAIALFALMIKHHGLLIPLRLKAALFASETVYSWERQIVEEVFGCRVFSFYGQTEKVVLAGECENGHDYHCLPQYGVTETDGETNEIIGTSFLNHVNPFIRYRTTDVAQGLSDSACTDCGRDYYPIFSGIEGRLEDFILTPEGVSIAPAVITHPLKDLKTIKNTQILQESLDCIKVKIVPWDQYDLETLEKESDAIREGLRGVLGPDMKIEIEISQSVDFSATRKFKWIVSDLHKDYFGMIQ